MKHVSCIIRFALPSLRGDLTIYNVPRNVFLQPSGIVQISNTIYFKLYAFFLTNKQKFYVFFFTAKQSSFLTCLEDEDNHLGTNEYSYIYCKPNKENILEYNIN